MASPNATIGGIYEFPGRRADDLSKLQIKAEWAASRCLDMAVEYAEVRHQFGQPIGSFQEIKHKCADLLLGVESLRSAVS